MFDALCILQKKKKITRNNLWKRNENNNKCNKKEIREKEKTRRKNSVLVFRWTRKTGNWTSMLSAPFGDSYFRQLTIVGTEEWQRIGDWEQSLTYVIKYIYVGYIGNKLSFLINS